MNSRADRRIAALIVLGVWAVYMSSPVALSLDSRLIVPTALSILHEGNLDLDEFMPELEHDKFLQIVRINGHYYSYHPAGTALLASPFVFVIDRVLKVAQPILQPLADRFSSRMVRGVLSGDLSTGYMIVEVAISSFFTAIAAALVFLIARRFLSTPRSLLLCAIYAFGTLSWSTVSRGLWAHSPTQFLLAAALLLLLSGGRSVAVAGLFLAVASIVRPTNAIPAALLGLYVAAYHRDRLVAFVLWAAPVLILFGLVNWQTYGSVLPPYFFLVGNLTSHPKLAEAFAGHLISPARGLFIYSPVFLLSLYGMMLPPVEGAPSRLRPFLCAIILLHYVTISFFPDWKGGHSIGSRYFSCLTILFVYFLIPVAMKKGPAFAALLLLSVPSVLINGRCGTRFACHQWNVFPVDINLQESRVWDWGDPPFLR